jgi:hypothetical protein
VILVESTSHCHRAAHSDKPRKCIFGEFDLTEMSLKSSNTTTHNTCVFKTRDAVAKLWRTVLPQPPYSPDLALTCFSLFGALKDVIRARMIGSDNEVTEKVEKWL